MTTHATGGSGGEVSPETHSQSRRSSLEVRKQVLGRYLTAVRSLQQGQITTCKWNTCERHLLRVRNKTLVHPSIRRRKVTSWHEGCNGNRRSIANSKRGTWREEFNDETRDAIFLGADTKRNQEGCLSRQYVEAACEL